MRRAMPTRGWVKFIGWMTAAVVLGASFSATAQMEDWLPELVGADSANYRKSDEPIIIRFPPGMPADAMESLAIELDDNDVTALASRSEDGHSFVLSAETPLPHGPHQLRVVQVDAVGNLIERGRWQFEVRQSSVFQQAESNYALSLDGSERVHARDESEQASSLEATGSARGGFMADTGVWTHDGHMELLYDSNATQTGAPRDVDLGDFLLSSRTPVSNFSVGHHFPGPVVGSTGSSLILDGGSRRGVSVGLGIPRWPTNFSAFALRTDSIYGFQHGLGVGDSNNRIDGLMFDTLIYASGEDRVKMGISHVGGSGEQGGTAIGDPAGNYNFVDPGVDGDASSFVVEGLLADGQITARAELAQASRDIGFGVGDISDNAYAALFGYQPKHGPIIGGTEMNWNVVLDHQKIGSLFESIAYPGGSADVVMTRINATAQLGELSGNLLLSRGEDNVNSFNIPTTQTSTNVLGLNYSPQVEPDKLPSWLQQPSASLVLSSDGRKYIDVPAGDMSAPVDVDVTAGSFSLSFAHPYGGWGLSYSPTRVKDHTGTFGSEKGRYLSLDSNFQVNSGYSVNPNVSLDRRTDETTNVSTRVLTFNLGQQVAIIQDVLNFGLNVSQSKTRLSDSTQDTTARNADLSLDWRTAYIKGLTLWLRGSYFESKERGTDFASLQMFDPYAVPGSKDYQVFIGFNYQLSSE